MNLQDLSSISRSTAGNHQQQQQLSPSKANNILIAQFVKECNKRNVTAPSAVVQALQSTVSNGGIFELQDCMLGEHAIAALCHALSYCFGPVPPHLLRKNQNKNAIEQSDDEDDDDDEELQDDDQQAEELTLKQLSIRNAYIGDQGCVSILRFLIKNAVNSLEVLELPGNSISESCSEVATAVAVLTKLKKINLDWNKIGATNTSLRTRTDDTANINNNNANTTASSSSATSLGQARVTSASENNLNNNTSTGTSPTSAVHRLLNALATHHSIEQVSLQNNLFGRSSVEDVCHLVATSRTLEHFDISWNSLGEAGGARIANAVNRSPSDKLTTVEVQGNSFTRKDCELIERKLRTNRDIGAKTEAARQQEDELRMSIEKLQREVLNLRGQLGETRAKYSAQEMLFAASRTGEQSAKEDREKFHQLMKEAQDTLHSERMNFQRKLDDEHNRCSDAIEQASRRVRESCEAADEAQSKARIQRAEMEGELTVSRDKRYAAEKEASTAVAGTLAAQQAMERIQSEHSVVSRSLTESRQRIAELELQVKVRDDEIERLRAGASTAAVDLDASKSLQRQTQESTEQLKIKVKDLEYQIEQSEKRRSEELRAALLRSENEQKEDVAAAQRQTKQAEQDKLATEKTMVELKAQFENSRRQFEANAAESSAHADRMRTKLSEMELEMEKVTSKLSLLEIEAGRSDSRAKTSEEKARLLQQELQSSLHQYKERLEDLARDFERKLSDKESELFEKSRTSRTQTEEIALLRAKNDALSAKMKQQQVDLEKRVVKSLRNAMQDVHQVRRQTSNSNNNANANNTNNNSEDTDEQQ